MRCDTKKYFRGRESVQCCVTTTLKVLTQADGEEKNKNVRSLLLARISLKYVRGEVKQGINEKILLVIKKNKWINYGEI